TLGEAARKHILEQTELSICVCDSAARVRNILKDTRATGNWVRHIILVHTLGEAARKHILEQTELSICVCDSAARVRNILKDTRATGNWVRHIILVHPSSGTTGLPKGVMICNIKLHTFDEVLAMGKADAQPGKLPQADDLHLICYTSGTTGLPKGVMITHRMIVSVIAGFDMDLQEVNIGPGD
ncbi:AMP-binding protein, partial [Nitriliruptoraceae bacterium ZYF776]|nr:AMP-binding protein [Profundirhabdus halotolerans]